jgi:hypothetical protein
MNLFKNMTPAKLIVFVATGVLTLVLSLLYVACSDEPPQQNNKNRVPNTQLYADQAQQAAADAKAAADRVAQAQKDIDASVAKLNGVQRDSEGNLKEGRPETTTAGNIVQFSNTGGDSFTFAERTGYVKIFTPLCADTTIPGSKTVVVMYHWQATDNSGRAGCYKVDGFSIVQ